MLSWRKNKTPEETPEKSSARPPQAPSAATDSQLRAGGGTATTISPPAAPAPTKSLAEILAQEGVITEWQLRESVADQGKSRTPLVPILIEKGFIRGDALSSFLAKHFGMPHVSLMDYLVNEELFQLIPKELCQRHSLLPLDKLGKNLTIAMVNPLDTEAIEVVRTQCPGLRVKPILCDWNGFRFVMDKAQGNKKEAVDMTAASLGLSARPAAARPAVSAEPAAPVAEAAQAEIIELVPAGGLLEEAVEIGVEEASKTPAAAQQEARQSVAIGNARADKGEWKQLMEYAQQLQAMPGKSPLAGRSPIVVPPASPSWEEQMAEPKGDTQGAVNNLDAVIQSSKHDTYAVLGRRLALFHGLEPEEVATVFESGMMLEMEEGRIIFEKDGTDKDLFVVISGEVTIRDGETELASLMSGEMFGEMSLITNEPRSATAVAKSMVSLFVLKEEGFQNLLTKRVCIRVLLNIILTLSQRLREANER